MSTTESIAPPVRSYAGLEIPTAGRYEIDAAHTTVEFVAKHLMVSKVRGRFVDLEGAITVAEEPLDSTVEVTLQAASLDSGNPDRDDHVRAADFLDVENHPTVTFRSSAVRHLRGDDFEVDGELSIKGSSRPVTLELEFGGVVTDPWGGQRVGFSAETEIDREDWGLNWNVALEAGGVLVSKKIKVQIEGEAVRA